MALSQLVEVFVCTNGSLLTGLTAACQVFERLTTEHLVSFVSFGPLCPFYCKVRWDCGFVGLFVCAWQRVVEKALAVVPQGDARLRMFSALWTAHRLVTEWLVRMFSPVDCGDPHNKDKMTLVEFKRVVSLTSWAHREFKAVVFTTAKEGLVQSVHDVMNRDREGAVVDRSAVKNAIDMFLVMGACDTDAVQNLRNDVDMRRRVRVLRVPVCPVPSCAAPLPKDLPCVCGGIAVNALCRCCKATWRWTRRL
jgi:hypothetical protein